MLHLGVDSEVAYSVQGTRVPCHVDHRLSWVLKIVSTWKPQELCQVPATTIASVCGVEVSQPLGHVFGHMRGNRMSQTPQALIPSGAAFNQVCRGDEKLLRRTSIQIGPDGWALLNVVLAALRTLEQLRAVVHVCVVLTVFDYSS